MPGRGSWQHPYPHSAYRVVIEDSVPCSRVGAHSASFCPPQTTSLTWEVLRAAGSRLLARKSGKKTTRAHVFESSFFLKKYRHDFATDQNPQYCRPGTDTEALQKFEVSRSLNSPALILPEGETFQMFGRL